jgi:NADH-quinone oxidoreductase subunit N
MSFADFIVLMPEIILALFAGAGMVFARTTRQDDIAARLVWAAFVLCLVLAAWIFSSVGGTQTAFGGAIVDDPFARFGKVTVLLGTAAVLVMYHASLRARGEMFVSFPLLIALSAAGLLLLLSAVSLWAMLPGALLYLGALYAVMAAQGKPQEMPLAAMFIAISVLMISAVLLIAVSAGQGTLDGIADQEQGVVLRIGVVLLIAALAAPLGIAPFHLWVPFLYTALPRPVVACIAIVPPMALFAPLARLLAGADGWGSLLTLLSVLTMLVGSAALVVQKDIRRLIAFAVVAQTGFALAGLAAGGVAGVQAMLIVLVIFTVLNTGMFAFLLTMEKDGQPVTDIDALTGYAQHSASRALALLVLLLGFAGVPPLLGFAGKLYVFHAAYEAGFGVLAGAGALASVIGAVAFLRIAFAIYTDTAKAMLLDRHREAALPGIAILVAIILVLGIGTFFGIETAARLAAEALVL